MDHVTQGPNYHRVDDNGAPCEWTARLVLVVVCGDVVWWCVVMVRGGSVVM